LVNVNQKRPILLDPETLHAASRPLLDSLPFPILWIDANYEVCYRNTEAERMYGTAGRTCHEITHGYSRPCAENGESCPLGEATCKLAPVTVCHAHVTGGNSISLHKVVAVPLSGGGILECHIDLDDLISEDGLTHICGRGFFRRIVERGLTLLQRLERPYAFIVIDLDGFKAINDNYGHGVGDEVLRQSAAALQQGLRKSDAAGRWGGDEFVLFLPSLTRVDAVALAQRKAQAIRRLAIPSDAGDVRPRASFGVFWSDRMYELQSAFRNADRALYSAKRAGGDRVVAAPERRGQTMKYRILQPRPNRT
jgi:diguanylate cyclase (GGDEF)-like protein